MIKILIGGSPCTHWSIAQSTDRRETTASGLGWDLFENYLLMKKWLNPDYFLYENNRSADEEIKWQIQEKLETPLMYIDSSLLTAQSRERFYVFNWNIKQPEDLQLYLKDIILPASSVDKKYWYYNVPFKDYDSSKSVIASLEVNGKDIVKRIYNIQGKAPTLTCDGEGGYRVKKILQNGIPRKLTPLEYERLQSLPDNYTNYVSDSKRYTAVGNGWSAKIIMHILEGALKNVNKSEKLLVVSMYDGIATGRFCLEQLGFHNIEYHAFEIDPYAIMIAKSNYPDIVEHGDAFQIRNKDFSLYENVV